jgi:hypothetical protein
MNCQQMIMMNDTLMALPCLENSSLPQGGEDWASAQSWNAVLPVSSLAEELVPVLQVRTGLHTF